MDAPAPEHPRQLTMDAINIPDRLQTENAVAIPPLDGTNFVL